MTKKMMMTLLSATMFFASAGEAGETAKVKSAMSQFYDGLSQLMPYLTTSSDFTKAENKKFKKIVQDFTKATHKIDAKDSFLDNDPALKFVAAKFSENMDRARSLAGRGQTRHAKRVLKTTVGFCIACHSRTDRGVSFDSLPSPTGFAKLSAFEKGNFFHATRQFDRAVVEYEAALKDKKFASLKPWAWEIAFKRQLAITVRVKRDPSLTLELLSVIREKAKIPPSLKGLTKVWRDDAKIWAKQKESGKNVVSPAILIAAAEEREKEARGTGLISFLRASTLSHDALAKKKTGKKAAEIYYYAGVSSESLRDLNIWNLYETYFEYCIRTAPRSKWARECFIRLEKNLTPPDPSLMSAADSERLNQLRKLAFKKAKKN